VRQRSPILDDGTRKVCSQCERPLPYSAFGKKGRGGLRPECRECHGKYWVPYKEKVQPLQRTNHLKRTYNGFSDADYQALFERQQGLCAACGNAQTVMHYGKPLPLAVDHDHVTGKVRGLLCLACNRALGYLGDDPERIEALLRYAKSI
jgi:hypothetical protein